MSKGLTSATLSAFLTFTGAAAPKAEDKKDEWCTPFDGRWSAYFTITSDYSDAGIYNELKPTYYQGLGYNTPLLFEGPPVWMHLYGWSSNVRYPVVGEAFEVEFGANPNALLLDCRRSLEAGYVPYLDSGTPVELDHAYSERASPPSTISDPYFSARIRHSDDFFGQQGQNWNKRVRTGVPLDFGPLSRNPSMEIYGTYGNFRVDNFIRDGLPVNKCNYWQLGLTTLALDPEFHVAYVGTNISYESCACTNYCSGRLCFSMTKSF